MFCSDPACTYRITGIFCVERTPNPDFSYNHGRKHTAISYRIRGSAAFDLGKRQLTAGDGAVTYIPPGVDYGVKNDAHEKLIILHLQRIGVKTHSDRLSGLCAMNHGDGNIFCRTEQLNSPFSQHFAHARIGADFSVGRFGILMQIFKKGAHIRLIRFSKGNIIHCSRHLSIKELCGMFRHVVHKTLL